MTDHDQQSNSTDPRISGPPASLEEELFATYGSHLDGQDMSEQQVKAYLLALWKIMVAFVDLGFSVKPGENINKNSDLSFDDVLSFLHREETAHETVAPPETSKGKEQS